jgi:hypothetical protein
VKADNTQHPASQPESGKALVYVFHEERQNNANHGKSYFFFTVDPGAHRLCANWQSKIKIYSRQSSAASFVAEAGKVYYFRAQVNEITNPAPAHDETGAGRPRRSPVPYRLFLVQHVPP